MRKEDGRPICAFCSIAGHIRRERRKRLRAQASSSSLNYNSPIGQRKKKVQVTLEEWVEVEV